MLDNPIIRFLCEERARGNIGYLSSEFIRESLGRSRNGGWAKSFDDLWRQGYLLKGLEVDGFRRFLYRVSDEVFEEWSISIMSQ